MFDLSRILRIREGIRLDKAFMTALSSTTITKRRR